MKRAITIITEVFDDETQELIVRLENSSTESLAEELYKIGQAIERSSKASADYPFGCMAEPYDIEVEKSF